MISTFAVVCPIFGSLFFPNFGKTNKNLKKWSVQSTYYSKAIFYPKSGRMKLLNEYFHTKKY